MKSHTIGKTLVKPCLIKAVEEVLGEEAKKKIQEISLSNNTVKRIIEIMPNDIEELLSKIEKFFFRFAMRWNNWRSTMLPIICWFLDENYAII